MKRVVCIGIDPGKKGFITVFDGKQYTFYSMPEHKVPTGKKLKSGEPQMTNEFWEEGVYELAKKIFVDHNLSDKNTRCLIGIEKVGGRGGWSATNNFNFGYVAGLLKMLAIIIGGEIEMVRPQLWQTHIRWKYGFLKSKADAKEIAAAIVKDHFPDIDFRKTERATKVDDNKIDSFLICRWLYDTKKDEK